MRIKTTLFCLLSLSACVNNNSSARGLHAIDLTSVSNSESSLLVRQFSKLCLAQTASAQSILEKAKADDWREASKKTLNKEGLSKLVKTTLKIPGGGSPVEESQSILTNSFEDKMFVLEISERFDRKRLVSSGCTLFGKQGEFLKHCASLGELINRAPDQNTKYKESDAHFISWNAALSGKQARIRCITTPNSPTLPYEGTQLSVSLNPLAEIKTVRKSSLPQSGVSAR